MALNPESRIEQAACKQITQRFKAWCIKMADVHQVGFPDRLILLPDGRAMFLEFKQPDGRVAPMQKVVSRKLQALGHTVEVVDSTETALEAVGRFSHER